MALNVVAAAQDTPQEEHVWVHIIRASPHPKTLIGFLIAYTIFQLWWIYGILGKSLFSYKLGRYLYQISFVEIKFKKYLVGVGFRFATLKALQELADAQLQVNESFIWWPWDIKWRHPAVNRP